MSTLHTLMSIFSSFSNVNNRSFIPCTSKALGSFASFPLSSGVSDFFFFSSGRLYDYRNESHCLPDFFSNKQVIKSIKKIYSSNNTIDEDQLREGHFLASNILRLEQCELSPLQSPARSACHHKETITGNERDLVITHYGVCFSLSTLGKDRWRAVLKTENIPQS